MRTVTNLITGETTISEDAPLPPPLSPEETEANRIQDITDKANYYVLSRYTELKQRKYLSMATALQDKQIQGVILTTDEEATLQMIRDCNDWITSVRDIENAAIAGTTLAEDVVFP